MRAHGLIRRFFEAWKAELQQQKKQKDLQKQKEQTKEGYICRGKSKLYS